MPKKKRSRNRDSGAGIGLTLKGLKQCYSQGEGDLARDMSILGLGSLSNYLNLKIIGKIRGTMKIEKLKCSKLCTILVVIIVKIIFIHSFLF